MEVKQKRKQASIEDKLIKDIRDFVPLCHRFPTTVEVIEWARWKYKFHPSYKSMAKWARQLVERATNGMSVPAQVRESVFVLYPRAGNYIPGNILQEPKYPAGTEVGDTTVLRK